MATRTFIGDGSSHNWSATGAWVEGIVPTAADDVVFSSNTAGSILVIDGTSGAPSLCRSIDTTGYTRTITLASGKQLNVGDGTTGAFKMTAGMTFVPNGSSTVKFVSTTTGNNITTAGYVFIMVFDGVGGAWQLQDNVTGGSFIGLTNGSLDLNGKTLGSALTATFFSSSNSNTRTLTMGAATWNLGNGTGTPWDVTISTGMTLSAASSNIVMNSTGGNQTFSGGGLTYGTFTGTALTSGTTTMLGANTFGTLTLSLAAGTPNPTTGYALGANQTVTGTFTANGFNNADRTFIYSDTIGTARTITAATVTVTNADFRDITGAGAGSWNLTGVTGGGGDCGGNSGITFNTPKNCYMKTAVNANWSLNTLWVTASGGSTNITPATPLPQDTAFIDINGVTAGSKTITLDVPRIPTTNFTGVANTPAFAQNASTGGTECYGSLTLVSGMTHTGGTNITFAGRGSFTIDGGTLTWPATDTIIINTTSGSTYTLARNLTSSSGLTMTSGTFALGGFNWSGTAFNINGGTISGSGTLTGTTYTQTAGTVSTSSTITGTTYTQSGGTTTLGGTLTLTGAVALSGGTLNMNGFGETGATTLAVSGTGVLSLSGQFLCSSTITNSGGTINNTGASGELKTSGNAAITFSGGISTVKKITEVGTSNIVVSGTGLLTLPPGASATWTSGLFEMASGNTCSLVVQGRPVWSSGSLTVSGVGDVFGS